MRNVRVTVQHVEGVPGWVIALACLTLLVLWRWASVSQRPL